jgi:hypothetical protein
MFAVDTRYFDCSPNKLSSKNVSNLRGCYIAPAIFSHSITVLWLFLLPQSHLFPPRSQAVNIIACRMSKNRSDMPLAPTACVPRPELKLLLRLVKGYAPAGTHPLPDNTLSPLEECAVMMPESLAQLELSQKYSNFSSAIPEIVDSGIARGLLNQVEGGALKGGPVASQPCAACMLL